MIKFWKAEGLGNDFVIIDQNQNNNFSNYREFAKTFSSRRLGIGFDQLIIFDGYKTLFFNADGSSAETCGNGTRCLAKLLMDINGTNEITLETVVGPVACKKYNVDMISVDMPSPQHKKIDFNMRNQFSNKFPPLYVEVGNPHLVCFVDNVEDIKDLGPILSRSPLFPNGINVNFAKIVDKDTIELRVYERGAGLTPACGSGACASAYAYSIHSNLKNVDVSVAQPGGKLQISIDDNNICMTGPASIIFEGSVSFVA